MDAKKTFEYTVPREYLNIVCTFRLFAQWFSVASPELLASPVCDLALKKWILATATIMDDQQQQTYLRMNCSLPLYFYRQGPRDQLRSATKLPDDLETAGPLAMLHEQLRIW
jgi:hypothetical protein